MIKHYIGIQEEWKISQIQLDQLIKDCPFKEGDVLRLKTSTEITAIGQCFVVVDLEKDIYKIDYCYKHTPRFMRIMSCYFAEDNKNIFTRLDKDTDYIKLESSTFKEIIAPIYDKLQDCIKREKQTT